MPTEREWHVDPGSWTIPTGGLRGVELIAEGATAAGSPGTPAPERRRLVTDLPSNATVTVEPGTTATVAGSDSVVRIGSTVLLRAAGRGRPAGSGGAVIGTSPSIDGRVLAVWVPYPSAPTLTGPASGTPVDRTVTQRLSWLHGAEDPQVQAQVRWRPAGGTTWTDVTVAGTAGHYDVPGGTLPAGEVEWTARTATSQGWGPWATPRTVVAQDQPDDAEIITPPAGTIIIDHDFVVAWVAAVQAEAEVSIESGIGGGPTYWTTTVGPDVREVVVPGTSLPGPATPIYVRVRIRVGGLWSDWRSLHATWDPRTPATPVVAVLAGRPPGMITVVWGSPQDVPSGTPTTVAVDIWRRVRAGRPRQLEVAGWVDLGLLDGGPRYVDGHRVEVHPDVDGVGRLVTVPHPTGTMTVDDPAGPPQLLLERAGPSGWVTDPADAGVEWEYQVVAYADSGAVAASPWTPGDTVVPDGWQIRVDRRGRISTSRTWRDPTVEQIQGYLVWAGPDGALHTAPQEEE